MVPTITMKYLANFGQRKGHRFVFQRLEDWKSWKFKMESGPACQLEAPLNHSHWSPVHVRVTPRMVTRRWPYTTGGHHPTCAVPPTLIPTPLLGQAKSVFPPRMVTRRWPYTTGGHHPTCAMPPTLIPTPLLGEAKSIFLASCSPSPSYALPSPCVIPLLQCRSPSRLMHHLMAIFVRLRLAVDWRPCPRSSRYGSACQSSTGLPPQQPWAPLCRQPRSTKEMSHRRCHGHPTGSTSLVGQTIGVLGRLSVPPAPSRDPERHTTGAVFFIVRAPPRWRPASDRVCPAPSFASTRATPCCSSIDPVTMATSGLSCPCCSSSPSHRHHCQCTPVSLLPLRLLKPV
jgi:hypothetical protein